MSAEHHHHEFEGRRRGTTGSAQADCTLLKYETEKEKPPTGLQTADGQDVLQCSGKIAR